MHIFWTKMPSSFLHVGLECLLPWCINSQPQQCILPLFPSFPPSGSIRTGSLINLLLVYSSCPLPRKQSSSSARFKALGSRTMKFKNSYLSSGHPLLARTLVQADLTKHFTLSTRGGAGACYLTGSQPEGPAGERRGI